MYAGEQFPMIVERRLSNHPPTLEGIGELVQNPVPRGIGNAYGDPDYIHKHRPVDK